jgi:hypothetical protein
MMTSKVRTVGLSLLGGGREALPDDDSNFGGVEGRFELGIKSIQAVVRGPEDGEAHFRVSRAEAHTNSCILLIDLIGSDLLGDKQRVLE